MFQRLIYQKRSHYWPHLVFFGKHSGDTNLLIGLVLLLLLVLLASTHSR